MFCSNCGEEVGENTLFCSNCGIKLTHFEENEEKELKQEFIGNSFPEEKGVDTETDNNKEPNKKHASILKTMLLLICIAMSVIGIYYVSRVLKQNEIKREREEYVQRVQNTLRALGDRSSGSVDFNTAEYSMALANFSSAALRKEMVSDDKGLEAEEIKEKRFKSLERYFEGDYLKSYAAMLFGADYFTEDDFEYFYDGTKISEYELKECVEDLLFKNHISLSTLLVNVWDEHICYTMNSRIRLANDGYIETEDIVKELYQFVFEKKSIRTINQELLSEEVTYEQVANDLEESFTGNIMYYNDLSPVGKMVFLYLMPRYIVQFDQAAGSELWNNYFESEYEKCWKEIIERDMFAEIIEQ